MEPFDTLPEIWVRVSGINPKHKGDFLANWAIGYLFGKTLKIDMKYTREHGVLRILIGCLNHTKIPRTFPMFIKDELYMLSFHVEGEEQRANKDVIMAEPRDNDEDDDPEDEDLRDDFRELDKENSSSKSGGRRPMDPIRRIHRRLNNQEELRLRRRATWLGPEWCFLLLCVVLLIKLWQRWALQLCDV